MSKIVNEITDINAPAKFLAEVITAQLSSGKKVLWFVPGGSAIVVVVATANLIAKAPHNNLTVTLSDERYGEVGHPNSNWHQLLQAGFKLPEATLMPVLQGKDINTTTLKFNQSLEGMLTRADYKIALLGIGADGHTPGILPGSSAVESVDYASSYSTPEFERITITPKTIVELDEAVVFMQGEAKAKILQEFTETIDVHKQPAQILKIIPKLTIFYKKQ